MNTPDVNWTRVFILWAAMIITAIVVMAFCINDVTAREAAIAIMTTMIACGFAVGVR